MKHKIDICASPRRAHFAYFKGMASPFVGVTVNVDVTGLVHACRRDGRSFYAAMIHAVARAANRVPELRRRIIDGDVWEFDVCPTSHIEPLDNGAYCYCTLTHDLDGDAYFEYADSARAAAVRRAEISEDGDPDSMLFITCLPWIHYTALVQPTGDDSNPRISWGKYACDAEGHCMLPVTLLAHHALVDGLHIAQFYRKLDAALL